MLTFATAVVLNGFLPQGMYYNEAVQAEYKDRYPTGTNPVHSNDVFFAVHAVFITLVTIGQCIIYERGGQKVAMWCRVLLAAAWTFVIVYVHSDES